MPHRKLNLDEAASYLHKAAEELLLLARRREIPSERQGERFVFMRRDLDAWASQHIIGLEAKKLRHYHRTSSSGVRRKSAQAPAIVSTLLRGDCFDPAMTSRTKASVLRDMVALAERTGLLQYSAEELLTSLREREEMCSTAVGDDIALLHPRHHDPFMFADSFIVIGRLVHAIPFGAPDGRTTRFFFLICCQEDAIHLHVLARLCMMVRETPLIEQLQATGTAEEMVAAVAAAEEAVIQHLPPP